MRAKDMNGTMNRACRSVQQDQLATNKYSSWPLYPLHFGFSCRNRWGFTMQEYEGF
jgi:hypothetical protein